MAAFTHGSKPWYDHSLTCCQCHQRYLIPLHNQQLSHFLTIITNIIPFSDREMDQRVYHLLQATKNMCQLRRPEVHVDIIIRQGKEKGAVIVEAAEQLRVSLLILGRRNEPFWHLWIWMRKATQSNVVVYCFQNANCMTVAVRKSKKCGGYLITTKHHKNFWLLA